MSAKLSLTYNVEYEIGLAAESLTPARIHEISAIESAFLCRCLFYLLRQAATSASHDPRFNPDVFLSALESITLLGEAISQATHEHVEQLAHLTKPRE